MKVSVKLRPELNTETAQRRTQLHKEPKIKMLNMPPTGSETREQRRWSGSGGLWGPA